MIGLKPQEVKFRSSPRTPSRQTTAVSSGPPCLSWTPGLRLMQVLIGMRPPCSAASSSLRCFAEVDCLPSHTDDCHVGAGLEIPACMGSGSTTMTHFTELYQGSGIRTVLIDAVHATGPGGEPGTAEIARGVSRATGCHCILGTVSRRAADLNRPPNRRNRSAILEYRRRIETVLREADLLNDGVLTQPFLHLAIHGMHDDHGHDIEIGTRHGETCSEPVASWIYEKLEAWTHHLEPRPVVERDFELIGDRSKAFHRSGHRATAYAGYGSKFNTVQLEWARWLRDDHRKAVIEVLSSVVTEFDTSFAGDSKGS